MEVYVHCLKEGDLSKKPRKLIGMLGLTRVLGGMVII